MCYYTVFYLFYSDLGAISKYKPPGAYLRRGDLTGLFCVTSLGGLNLEGLIFGILPYLSLLYPELAQNRQMKTGPNIDRRTLNDPHNSSDHKCASYKSGG